MAMSLKLMYTTLHWLRALRPTVWVRASYWWHFAGIACFTPFIALHYRQLGLSGWQIGVLSAITPLGMAILAPMWGALADQYAAHRLILRISLSMSALSALLLTQVTTFIPILLMIVALAVFVAPVPSMLDGYAVTLSEREGGSYGKLRVWGSLGFIALVWVIGWLMGGSLSTLFLFGYAACLLLTLGSTLGLPRLDVRSAQPVWRGVQTILRQRAVLLLLGTSFFVSTNTSFIFYFFGIYLDQLGGTAQLIGIASAVMAISELPVLLFGSWLLARLDNWWVLALAIAIYIARFLLYSIAPSAAWILPVQLLHGLSFGAYLMASVTLMHQFVGRELMVTAQALLSSMSFGFGSICGSLLGGVLIDLLSFAAIFRLSSFMLGLLLVVFFVLVRRYAAPDAVPEPVLQPSEERPIS